MIRLETDRLIIRDHEYEDLEGLHQLLSSEENTYFISDLRTHSMDESRENLFEAMKHAKLDNRLKVFLAIEEKATGNYVGDIGYTISEQATEGAVAEMGYFVLKSFWGKGYVTEAAKSVLDFAFTKGGIIKIETGCNKANVASENIMIKLGMVKEAHLVMHSVIDGILYDRVCYRLLKSEWEQMKDRTFDKRK